MASNLGAVSTALARFMDGGSYWPLYRTVLEAVDRIDGATDLTDRDVQWLDQLNEMIYLGSDGPMSDADREAGLMDADGLRTRIREARLQEWGPAPG